MQFALRSLPMSLPTGLKWRASSFAVPALSQLLKLPIASVNHVCGVLSLEQPFRAKPTVLQTDDDAAQTPQGSPRRVEKGVLRPPARRFDIAGDAVLRESRALLNVQQEEQGFEPVVVVHDAEEF